MVNVLLWCLDLILPQQMCWPSKGHIDPSSSEAKNGTVSLTHQNSQRSKRRSIPRQTHITNDKVVPHNRCPQNDTPSPHRLCEWDSYEKGEPTRKTTRVTSRCFQSFFAWYASNSDSGYEHESLFNNEHIVLPLLRQPTSRRCQVARRTTRRPLSPRPAKSNWFRP